MQNAHRSIRGRGTAIATLALFLGLMCAHAWHFPFEHCKAAGKKTVADTQTVCPLCMGAFSPVANAAVKAPVAPAGYSFVPVNLAATRPSSGRSTELFIRPPPSGVPAGSYA